MAKLKSAILAIALLLMAAFPAHAEPAYTKAAMVQLITAETKNKVAPSEIVRIVNAVFREAQRYSLDPFLIFSLIKAESTYRSNARSSYGAVGLMQVVPRFHRDKLRGRNPANIETNIEVGTKVLVDCLDRYNGGLRPALRCYSGGARNYATKLKLGHATAKKADILYRFENELPITVVSKFEDPTAFATSVSASQYAASRPAPSSTTYIFVADGRSTY